MAISVSDITKGKREGILPLGTLEKVVFISKLNSLFAEGSTLLFDTCVIVSDNKCIWRRQAIVALLYDKMIYHTIDWSQCIRVGF